MNAEYAWMNLMRKDHVRQMGATPYNPFFLSRCAGHYETRFLRQMKARYILAPDDLEIVDRLIETLVNLVGCIYGKVYFPTYSNSLKEVGLEMPMLLRSTSWRS